MRNTHRAVFLSVTIVSAAVGCSSSASAGFADDSKARLEMRNMFIKRDYRQEGGRPSPREWAQGFTLRFESGFTDGPIGFGLDAMVQAGVKLASTKKHSGTGLLPVDSNGRAEDEYSELGLTAKLRVSQSVLRIGTLQPRLPVISYNDTRLLASTYRGGMLTSQEINGLMLNVGRFTRYNTRDSTNNERISYPLAGVESDYLDVAGGSYAFSPQLTASYYYAKMEDVYQQNFFGIIHDFHLGKGVSLRTDLRYFDSDDDGSRKLRSDRRVDGGRIDNHMSTGMVTLSAKGHQLGVGYQRLSGDGDFPSPGIDPYIVNLSMLNTFTKAETDAWQLRYAYDFADMGIPGLTFATKYVKAHNIKAAAVNNGHEWEHNSDIAYVVQSGTLKGANFRLRNASYRSSNGLAKSQMDEIRIIVGYTLPIW